MAIECITTDPAGAARPQDPRISPIAGAARGPNPRTDAEPPGDRNESLPPAACRQSSRLVPLGARGAGARPYRRPADSAERRIRGLPLVPRDGARIVRRSGHGAVDERAVR